MRKLFLIALLFAFALPFTAQKAQAQFTLMPYLGYNLDAEGFLVGIGGEFAAPFEISNLILSVRPSVEYTFTDSFGGIGIDSDDVSVTFIQINGDVIADFSTPGATIAPFAGAGLAIVSTSVDIDGIDCDDFGLDCSSTDFGLNLLGGVTFPGALGFGDPFAQGRLTLADGSAISILGGLRIPLGQN